MTMEAWPPVGGIAKRMLQQRKPNFYTTDLAKETDRLTLEHLDFLAELLCGTRMICCKDPDES
jgi:hypothetical protein